MKIRIIITLLSLFVVSHELVFGQDLQLTITNVTCNGLCNGVINLNLISTQNCGNGPYQYQIIGPSPSVATTTSPVTSATTYSFTNLCVGTYTIRVLVNGNECYSTPQPIIGPNALTSGVAVTQPLCNQLNSVGNNYLGSAIVTVSGGSTGGCFNGCRGYNVYWTGPGGINGGSLNACPKEILFAPSCNPPESNTYVMNGLQPGTYNISIEDNNNCPTSTSFTITPPSAINVTNTITNVPCNGGTGSILVSPTGGTPGYNVSWGGTSPGDPNGSTPETVPYSISPLTIGTYNVTVTDANGCTATQNNIAITQPPALQVTSSTTPVLCFNGTNGTATFTVSGGVAGYNISWTGTTAGGNPVSGNPAGFEIAAVGGSYTANNLAAGTYTFTVTDNGGGCSASVNITITQPTSALSVSTTAQNILCFGANNGSILVYGTGGTPQGNLPSNGYHVSWTGQSSGPAGALNAAIEIPTSNPSIISGYYAIGSLAPGNYTVTLTDANSCTSQQNITITQPPQMFLAETHVNNLCHGGASGSINLTPTGGTAPYAYLWSNGSTVQDPQNLAAGTYSVVVTDANNCQVSFPNIQITQPLPLTITSVIGANNIDITVSGGTAPYVYSWSNGATTEDLSNLSPGTYSVVVYDLNGCTETASYTVQNQNPVLSVNWAISHILCFGDQNGMINLTVAGGNAPYNVSWTGPVFGNPAGNEIANSGGSYLIANMPAGTYTITITDSNGNSTNISATITQPQSPLTLLTITTNNLCFGAQTGAIDLTVSGGTGIYAYSWNTGAITQDITGLAAGLYMVTVIDANGCTATTVATITQPQSPLTLTTTQVNVLCNGANTGSINLTPTGGTAPYMYLWSNGSTVQDPQNLAAGTYSVVVTDANGCTAFASAVITQPANPLSASYSQWDVTCNGLSNGAIDVTVTGGSQPYTYAWSHGPTTEDLTGLSAGTYNLTITYAQQCTSSLSVTITEPPALSLSTNESNVSCNSGGNGSIDLAVSGGTAPYTYLWNNGSFSQDINNLSTGTYTVTVTDANGCTAMTVATITQPSAILLSGSINGNNIDITVTGGIPGYTYSWSNGAITQDLTNLSPGTYTVTVTDANNCTVTASYTIQNQNPPLSVTSAISPVLCAGGQDGSIIVTVAGGNGPYNVSWTGPVSGNPAGNEIANSGGSYLIANLPAGIYSVTVTDANGTLDIIQLVITQPTPIVTSYNIASVTCYGGNDGSIFLTISGGVPSYYLQWSNGSNSQNLSNLSAGVYNFIITDANNCTMQGSINITQPPLLTITGTTSNNNIDISISGGTAPYVYLWSNGATTQDLTNLSPGIYAVSVTDANGCLISQSFTIQNQNPPLSVTSAISPVSCAGGQDGSIIVTAAGGNAPYNLSWTGPVVGNPAGNEIANSGGSYLIANMPAGTYTITITDSNGNSTNISATITQPSTIQVAAAVTGVACNGNSTGAIDLTVSGGTGAYTYLWSNGATTEDISSLPSATYNVTVTDVNGCTVQASTTITQPQSPLTLTTTQVNVLCNGASTGSVNLTVSGGTAGYSYLWSNGSTGEDLTGLPAGTYSVTVTDANGCTAMTVATITEPLPILLTGSVNGNNIDISVSGGTVPYNYSWSSGDVTQDLANVSSGTYSVTVTDAFNCSITDTFIVNNVGLEQQESIELQVFPNPAQDMVTIRSSSTGIGNTYRMLDCYGRNVLEGTLTSQENNINIQTLANGVYHLQLGANTVSFVVSH